MKLKFIKDSKINGEIKYHAGETYDIDDSLGSASRWLTRQHAVEVESVIKEKKEEKEEVKKEEIKDNKIANPKLKVENKADTKSSKGK